MHRKIIEEAWENRELLKEKNVQDAINEVVSQLDQGELRVAEKTGHEWQVHEWIKKAVILYRGKFTPEYEYMEQFLDE